MSSFVKFEQGKKLLDAGYSIMVIDEKKRPLIPWKELQKTSWTPEQLTENLDQVPNIWRYGLITGFGDLFCIDIDLKVFANVADREPFFKELLSFIKDNIDAFDKKIAVYKTQNFGYHLVYRARTDMGNKKLARLKGHREAVIETRGVGGYIVVYDDCMNEMDYTSVQLLTEEEHNMIIEICRFYDQPPEQEKQVKEQKIDSFDAKGLTPWDDFNQRNTVMDVIGDEFEIVRTIQSRYIIRRHGAESAHSGYIYRDSNCLYLFSTGTRYPNEQLLSAFSCYVHKYHSGDYSRAAKQIYSEGYGDRVVKPVEIIEDEVIIDESKLDFPIDIFPKGIQHYLIECNRTLDSSIDYMGSGLIWMLSVIIGNSMRIKVKNGWTEGSVVWIAVVGKAGLGKTPSIDNVVHPLMSINNREIKQYKRQYAKFKEYDALTERQKKTAEEVREPVKKQFIVNDVTIEALVELHEENQNAVGVFKDELAGWMKDMNKYRAGSDLEFWLSTWSQKPVSLNRKTVKNTHVERPLIPVLGGIQPAILNDLFTVEQKENGFVDRMLLTFPDLQVEEYNENELDQELLQWYYDYILHLYSDIKNHILKYDEEREIIPHVISLSDEAKKEWRRIFNKITEMQNSDDENEYMKSMLPKQKSYIPRFALMLSVLEKHHSKKPILDPISAEAMRKAERLSMYFIEMAKKLKVETIKINKLKAAIEGRGKTTEFDMFKMMLEQDPGLKKKDAAELLNVSRMTLNRWEKQINEMNEGKVKKDDSTS